MKYFVFLLFAFSQAASQMPDYFVYQVKGDASAQKANASPVRLKQHQLIFPTETIILKKDAEVTLSNKDATFLVLNTPGAHDVKALSKLKPKPIDNVTKKYLGLLYHELLDPNHDYSKFKKENTGAIWGGVSRGDCNNLLFPVKGMKTAEKNLSFRWRKTSPVNTYKLKLFNSEANEIAVINVKDSFLKVELQQYITVPSGKYYWLVQGVQAECEEEIPIAFEIISKGQEEKIILELENGNTHLAHKLFVIDKLETFSLITAAQRYFQTLLSDNSGNMSLAKTYAWFLLKYRLEDEAAKVWEYAIDKKQ